MLKQTYKEWELILVDDASSDETAQVVKRLSDPRITYIRHAQNRGAASARNTGIYRACGSYVAFLDSDDEWLPEKLAKDISALESRDGNVGLVYSGETLFDIEGRLLQTVIPRVEGSIFPDLLKSDFINSCSKVTVRSLVLRMVGGFDESLRTQQDWELWLRVAKRFEVVCVPESLVKRHLGPDRLSSSLRRIYEGRSAVVQKYRSEMTRQVLAGHLARLAIILLNYDTRRGRELAFQALSLNWVQPMLFGALGTSLLGIVVYRHFFSMLAKLRHGVYLGRAEI